ncbi:DNA cytosine methyltransferase [Saccharopolyspora sp. NPDC002376]
MNTAISRTATHRPATRRRRFRHDDLVAVDLFSGFGGLTQGIKEAGFATIMAANHNEYKVSIHEANHPEAEHWIADLVDPEAADYHSARDLPAADLLVAGVSCVNHSQANTQKAYAQGLSLFDLDDPDFESRVTRSERDRATANCVLHYAERNHPRMILVECTTELTSWGPALPGRPKVGDGSTYRWWLKQFDLLGYKHKVLYLNSQFFGVPQSRDRLYIAFWDRTLPDPDLEHRPATWCGRCEQTVEAVWSWRTGIPATGSVRYGKQYDYRCPRCRSEIVPPMTPSLLALDLSNPGTRIGDRPKPLAPTTMARAERCRQKFAQFPALLMPAKSTHGTERHPLQPLSTQTSQQETALLATGSVFAAHRHNGDGKNITQPMDTVTSTHELAVMLAAVNNYQGVPRGMNEALPTQGGSETLSLMTAGVLPYRQNTIPAVHGEPMPTVTSDQIPSLLTAHTQASVPHNNAGTTEIGQGQLFTGWHQQDNGMLVAEWSQALAEVPLEDCHFRMLGPHEVGVGCGFNVDFGARKGDFIVWGSARNQVDGFGNAVSPAVGTWIGSRLRAAFHAQEAAA